MFTVALGAIKAILSASSFVRLLSLTLIMPFFPIVLLERLVATDIMPVTPAKSRIFATLKAASLGMWSITVPSFIAEIVSSFFILFFLRLMTIALFLPVPHSLPARNRLHAQYHPGFYRFRPLLAKDAL